MRIVDKSIPDRSRPGLPTTASGIAHQGTYGNYATASENKSRKRKESKETAGCVERKTLTHKGGYTFSDGYSNSGARGKDFQKLMFSKKEKEL